MEKKTSFVKTMPLSSASYKQLCDSDVYKFRYESRWPRSVKSHEPPVVVLRVTPGPEHQRHLGTC